MGATVVRITATLLALLFPLLAACVALGAYLNAANVGVIHTDLSEQRLQTLADSLADEAETALELGLPLPGQDGLGRALLRARQSDRTIGALAVFDGSGEVLFSDGIPTDREEALYAPIMTNFGTVAGEVLAWPDVALRDAAFDTFARRVWLAAAVAFVLSAAALVGLVIFAVHRQLRAADESAGAGWRATLADLEQSHDAIEADLQTVVQAETETNLADPR